MSDLDRYLTDEIVETALAAGNAASECYYGCPSDMTPTEMRASLSAVLPDIIQQAKAEAWEEGHLAGHEDARAVQPTYPQPTLNPYADIIQEEKR